MRQVHFSYEFLSDTSGAKILSNRLIDLLESVERHGSLAAAVEADFDISYRHAWNELRAWEVKIGQPLLERGRGKPGQLTAFSKKLLLSVRGVHARYKPQLEALRTDLQEAFVRAFDDSRPIVTFAGCPDVVVLALKKFALDSPFFLDVNFNSSERGLEDLAEGRTLVTGFNFPVGAGGDSAAAQTFRKYLDPHGMQLIRFCTRIQGIAVAKGNPLGLHSLLDVSLKKARYAQRAKGSGTRVLFEDLLHASGMVPEDIVLCKKLAASHVDVAGMISQGEADAGICLANVAAEADLDFIALSREVYFLACGRSFLRSKVGKDFLKLLRSEAWKAEVSQLAGYDLNGCGSVVDVAQALPWF